MASTNTTWNAETRTPSETRGRKRLWPDSDKLREWTDLVPLVLPDTSAHAASRDWKYLAEIAERNRLFPWMYCRRKSLEPYLPTGNNLETLCRSAFLQSAAHHLLIQHSLQRVAPLLADHGIPFLVIKGSALAYRYYPEPAARPCGDADFVVPFRSIEQTEELLAQLGYRLGQPEPYGSIARKMAHARAYSHPEYRGVVIDLHHRLLDDPARGNGSDSEWFWNETSVQELADARVRILKPEAHMLYLCAHVLCDHYWSPDFIWLLDVMLILRQEPLFDWEKFRALGQSTGWDVYAGIVFHTLREISAGKALPIPDHVAEGMVHADASRLLETLTGLPSSKSVRTWLRLRELSWKDQGLFAIRMLFPAPAYMIHHYHLAHTWLWPLSYPYRWGLFLKDLVLTTLRLIGLQFKKKSA